MILVHAADLLWATKIRATADACGVAVRPVRNVDMLEARLADRSEERTLFPYTTLFRRKSVV